MKRVNGGTTAWMNDIRQRKCVVTLICALGCGMQLWGAGNEDGYLRDREIALLQNIRARVMARVIVTPAGKEAILGRVDTLAVEITLGNVDVRDGANELIQLVNDLSCSVGREEIQPHAEGVACTLDLLEQNVQQWCQKERIWQVAARSLRRYAEKYAARLAPVVVVPLVITGGEQVKSLLKQLPIVDTLATTFVDPATEVITALWIKSYVKEVMLPAMRYAASAPIAYLCGEPAPQLKSWVRQSTVSLEHVALNEEARALLSDCALFIRHEQDYGTALCAVRKGLCIVGADTYETSRIAQAFAAEAGIGYATIHASELMKKPLKEFLETAEQLGPCVVIIEGLDWFFERIEAGSELWMGKMAELRAGLASYSTLGNKKGVTIVMTVQNAQMIDTVLRDFCGIHLVVESHDITRTLSAWVRATYGIELSDEALCGLRNVARVLGNQAARECVIAAFARAQVRHVSFSSELVVHHVKTAYQGVCTTQESAA